MKASTILFAPGLIAALYVALLTHETQGRGGQAPAAPAAPAPGGAAGAGGGGAAPAAGQVPPAPGGPAGAPGGQRGGARGGPGGAGGGGAAPRGGGGGPRNVQVLPAGTDIPATMQTFVQALGLLEKGTCTYCHAEDRSSDEKRPKQVARRMITMMRAINGTFPDGKPHVTCYTCHRGSTTPLMEPELPGLGQ